MTNKEFINRQKEMAELRKRVRLCTAYIGAGMVLAMHEEGYTDDQIDTIIARTNEVWVEVMEQGLDPIKWCYEKTGYQLFTEEQSRDIINSYFD